MRTFTLPAIQKTIGSICTDTSSESLLDAAFYYDAYLTITETNAVEEWFTFKTLCGFSGFLNAETLLDQQQAKNISWQLMHILTSAGVLPPANAEIILQNSTETNEKIYFSKTPSLSLKNHYNSWFPTKSDSGIFVDFKSLEGAYDIVSQDSLRSMFDVYLLGKCCVDADGDAQLIVGITRGLGFSWPKIALKDLHLNKADSTSFLAMIVNSSNVQMSMAGLPKSLYATNRKAIHTVITDFFVPNRIIANDNYAALFS
jgi:hypothetical protein